jgi:hypothetical protein
MNCTIRAAKNIEDVVELCRICRSIRRFVRLRISEGGSIVEEELISYMNLIGWRR